MAHVVFGNEFGANYGHGAAFAPTAEALLARGHQVTMILRDPKRADGFLDHLPVRILGAPMVFGPNPPRVPTHVWTQTLAVMKPQDPVALRMAVVAWRNLLDLVAPDVVLADAAPTLLLATGDQRVPRMTYASPWSTPSDAHPQPNVHRTVALTEQERLEVDRAALGQLNDAVAPLGLPRLEAVRDLYRVERRLVVTFRELDHLAEEREAVHLGPSFVVDRGQDYPWPAGAGPRIFAYLRATPRLQEALGALAEVRCRAVVVCPDAPEGNAGLPDHIALYRRAARLGPLLAEADAVMTPSAVGTGAAALLAGVPAVLVPNYLEHGVIADCVAARGLAEVVHPGEGSIREALQRVLEHASYRDAARSFAARHADFDVRKVGARAAMHIEEVMATSRPG